MPKSDVVIVGSGLGGLLCGALLAKEGYQVTVLEKNKQIGGSLQSFGVDGKLFESAVHYIGSLQKGQTLYKIFNYLGIIDKISLKKLNPDCFDKIIFDGKSYSLAQGHENFINTLSADFPHQKENLINYIKAIKHVCAHFPMYDLRIGSAEEKMKVAYFSLKEKMDELISDEKLKHILAGNNLLYASDYETTPFYIHALIENSYIESSWKCELGSIKVAKCLQDIIVKNGGQVIRNAEVAIIKENNGKIEFVETIKGERYFTKKVISNLHPAVTYSLLDSKIIKPITKKRIAGTANTSAALMVNISLEEKIIPYQDFNKYYHRQPDVWMDLKTPNDDMPNSYGIFFYQDQKNKEYARSVSILTYMTNKVFKKWEETFHTTNHKMQRGNEYNDKKNALAEKIIQEIEKIIPGIKNAIREIDVCTPLSYRDYLNIPGGSMYGLKKDVRDIANTTFATRTKIPNMFLTGQNINMHGVLGVSITALLTVSEITGLEYLVNKINNANT